MSSVTNFNPRLVRIAVIDIGSNSIKLLVAEPGPGRTLLPIRREKSMVRLGHETLVKGHLSSEATVVAIRTLSVFKALAQSLGAQQIIAIATASVREADNAAAFIKEVEQRTGVRIEVLSGVEEARLIGLAASHGCTNGAKSVLNIDIGGGSTELSLMRKIKPGQQWTPDMLHSMRIGAVRLTEQFLSNDPPKPKELLALQQEIEAALERPVREMKGAKWAAATGTSGSILSIGAAFQSMSYPDNESGQSGAVPSIAITRNSLAQFNREMLTMTATERKRLPGISEQRAEIIIAGGQILEHTMRALKIAKISTCGWSLREGVLLDRMSEIQSPRAARGLAESDARLAGAEALGERFGYEATHGKHVAVLAGELFDQLKSLHGLKEHDRTLLVAASILHDIGYAISHESHHKHSFYIILNSELTGFTDLERLLIANIARYHRRALPNQQHSAFANLSDEDQARVWMLGGILRVADATDRSHQSRVKHFKATRRGTVVRLELLSARRCDHELWAIENKKDMFEEAFGVTLQFVKD